MGKGDREGGHGRADAVTQGGKHVTDAQWNLREAVCHEMSAKLDSSAG